MPHLSKPAQLACTRLIGGLIALLLLCNATVIGGAQKSKTAVAGLWHAGHQAPLFTVFSYPKDFQRSAEARGREAGEGDELPDHSLALEAYPQPRLRADLRRGASRSRNALLVVFPDFRPQAPRAPPLA